jgi:hypothetical protein
VTTETKPTLTTEDGVIRLPTGGWMYTDDRYNARWLVRIKACTVLSERGCWIWQGNRKENGYGQTAYRAQTRILHRKMYEVVHGVTLDRWIYVCHSCDVKLCCNPDHLWLGTPKDNSQDSAAKGRHQESKRTHCKRGHEFTPDNTSYYECRPGVISRSCKACSRRRMRIAAGWPEHLAETLPPTPHGHRVMP